MQDPRAGGRLSSGDDAPSTEDLRTEEEAARARLATPPDAIRWDLGERPAVEAPKERLCVVEIAGRRLGILGRHSRGIHDLEDPTPIPLTPPHVLGLAHVRGHILPVVDLGRYPAGRPTHRPAPQAGPRSALILSLDDVRLCLTIDAVTAFEPFDPESIEGQGPEPPDDPWRPMLAGVARLKGLEPVPVLDLAAAIEALRPDPGAAP